MKRYLLLFTLLFTIPAFSQASPAKAPQAQPKAQAPPVLTELQIANLKLLIKDFQIAQLQQSQSQTNIEKANTAVITTLTEYRKSLGLDDSWDLDFQTFQWVKKPTK